MNEENEGAKAKPGVDSGFWTGILWALVLTALLLVLVWAFAFLAGVVVDLVVDGYGSGRGFLIR